MLLLRYWFGIFVEKVINFVELMIGWLIVRLRVGYCSV
jgi:hypothetical protein